MVASISGAVSPPANEAMPDLIGTEFARETRRLRPDVPIALMSVYGGTQLSARAATIGVNEVLRIREPAMQILHSLPQPRIARRAASERGFQVDEVRAPDDVVRRRIRIERCAAHGGRFPVREIRHADPELQVAEGVARIHVEVAVRGHPR